MISNASTPTSDNELFYRCFICHRVPSHPVASKCCGMVTCRKCITEWLESNFKCPRCYSEQHEMFLKSLSNAKFTTAAALLLGLDPSRAICPRHNEPMTQFCENCSEFYCLKCLAGDSALPHADHILVPVSNQTVSNENSIKMEIYHLSKAIDTLSSLFTSLENAIEISKLQSNDLILSMYAEYRNMKNSFETAVNSEDEKLKKLSEELQNLMQQAFLLINQAEDVLNSNDANLGFKSGRLSKDIKDFIEKAKKIQEPKVKKEWKNEITPSYTSLYIDIPDYVHIVSDIISSPQSRENPIYSTTLTFNGCTWKARCYPAGKGENVGTHLSLYCEVLNGVSTPISFQFSFEILHPVEGMRPISRNYISEFCDGDSWGWARFASIRDILKGNYVQSDGTLKIRVSIRPENYFQASKLRGIHLARVKARFQEIQQQQNEGSPSRDFTT